MAKLTKTMQHLLKNADLERGEINDVPMSTAYALEERQLVSSEWRKHLPKVTEGGNFPRFGRVKLTASGLRAAREVQGLSHE